VTYYQDLIYKSAKLLDCEDDTNMLPEVIHELKAKLAVSEETNKMRQVLIDRGEQTEHDTRAYWACLMDFNPSQQDSMENPTKEFIDNWTNDPELRKTLWAEGGGYGGQ
jgi:hypothetical protein